MRRRKKEVKRNNVREKNNNKAKKKELPRYVRKVLHTFVDLYACQRGW